MRQARWLIYLRGGFVAATGLTAVEAVRSAAGAGVERGGSELPLAAAWYVALMVVAAMLAGPLLRRFFGDDGRAMRFLAGLAWGGAGWAAVVLGAKWGLSSPASIAILAAVIAGSFVLARLGPVRGARPLGFAALAVTAGGVAAISLWPSASGKIPAPAELAAAHPSVLVVVVDSLRADHTSLHGYERETTPALDEFARQGLRFRQARSPSSWTKPSVASIFTGLPPAVHRVEGFKDALPAGARTLAESLGAAGYATAGFSDNVFVSPDFGFNRGFATFLHRGSALEERAWALPGSSIAGRLLTTVPALANRLVASPEGGRNHEEWGAERIVDRLLGWVEGVPAGKPFFGYVHFMEPHWPYEPRAESLGRFGPVVRDAPNLLELPRGLAPVREGVEVDPAVRRHWIDRYDEEIRDWDMQFGRLLRGLADRGRLEDTIVVVTADHGESFFEHRVWEHRSSLHEEQLHVPLVIRGPGIAPGEVAEPVSLLGLERTLTRLAGFAPPAAVVDVARALPPLAPAPPRSHFRLRVDDVLVLARIEWPRKWIVTIDAEGGERRQCFDLAADPGEGADLAPSLDDSSGDVAEDLRRREDSLARYGLEAEKAEVSAEVNEALRGHGYLR